MTTAQIRIERRDQVALITLDRPEKLNAWTNQITEMLVLGGEIINDPDFDLLRVRAGSGLGLPKSPGHTTLTRVGGPGSDYRAVSFFDIFIEIELSGRPGTAWAGVGGKGVRASHD